MDSIPTDCVAWLHLFAPAFSPATFCHAHLPAVAALLTTGRWTVTNVLRTAGDLADARPSTYHRIDAAGVAPDSEYRLRVDPELGVVSPPVRKEGEE